jgi:hypothetical protein
MADNVEVSSDAEYTVASEELTGGAHLQSIELHTESGGTKTKAATASNPLRVDPTGSTTQPVSVASLPLPTGAATAANQATIAGHLDGVEGLLTTIDADTGNLAAALDVALSTRAPKDHPALTPSAPASASVADSSGEAVAANASRKGLVLINLSNNTISLAFGAAAEVNKGITLQPQGGSWTMTKETFTTAQVRAIASAGGGSTLAIQEFV